MSDLPADYAERLDLREQIARIDRAIEEQVKLRAEARKLDAEAVKWVAEQGKLAAEANRLRLDRFWLLLWLWPPRWARSRRSLRSSSGCYRLDTEWSSKIRFGAVLEAIMPVNLSIKNAPDALVAKLKAQAALNHRSLQGEMMSILEGAVEYPVMTKARVDAIVAKIKAINLPHPSEAVQMIREDRDGDHH